MSSISSSNARRSRLLPDPEFLYLGQQHSSAKAFLESSAFVHDSFVVITGAIGAGKTTLVEGYLAELSANDTIIARINQTQISPTGFLRLLLDELGLRAFKAKKPELLSRFRKYMGRAVNEGKRVVLVIDEAQNLSRQVLEEVRMLTGGPHASALSVVLIGQPEFLETLRKPDLMQLAQRCRLRSHIEALPPSECRDYIDHRIAVAGGDPEKLFSASAKSAVYAATNGVPRLINSLCDTALICAFADGLTEVDEKVISNATRELNWQMPGASVQPDHAGKASQKNSRAEVAVGGQEAQEAELARLNAAKEELRIAQREIETLQAELSQRPAQNEDLAASHARLDKLQAAIEELSAAHSIVDDYQQLTDEVNELATALNAVDTRVEESEALIEDLSSRAQHSDSEQTQMVEQEGELARLKALAGEQATLIETLQAAAIDHAQADKDAADLQQSLVEQSATSEQLEKENRRLQAELADQQEKQQTLDAQLKSAIARQEELNASLSEQSASLLGRDNSIETLKAEVRNKSTLIDELRDKLASAQALTDGTTDLAAQCDLLAGQLEDEQQSTQQYTQRVADLEQLLAAREGDAESSARQCETLETRLTELMQQKDELELEFQTARSSVSGNAALIAELEKNRSSQLQTISDLELAQSRMEGQISEYEKQTEALNEKVRLSADASTGDAAMVSGLQQKEDEQASRISDLEKETDQMRADAAVRNGKLEEISAALKESMSERQQLIDSAADLNSKVAARDNTISTVEGELRRKTRLIDELHDKLAPLPELQEQVATLRSENAELTAELKARNERIFELQEAFSLGQQRLDEARREMEEAHGGQMNLHMELGELKTEIVTLQGESKSRDDLVTSLQTECQNRKSDLRKLRRELDESVDQSRELKDSLELGEQRVIDLEKQLEAAMETISEMGEASARVNSDVETYEREVNEQKEKLASLGHELTERNSELQTLEASLRHKTETIKVLQFDVEASSEARDAETASLSELQALVAQLRAEVEARDSRMDELLGTQEQSEDLANKLRGQIDEQSALVQELQKELAESQQETGVLEDAGREFKETAVLTGQDLNEEEDTAPHQVLEAGLIITANGHPARRIDLSNERMIIGRTGDSDIKIDNEFASRHHAQIVLRNGTYILEDLNSTNGIFVNSRRITKRRLRNRDVIRIGRDKMIFILGQHTSH